MYLLAKLTAGLCSLISNRLCFEICHIIGVCVCVCVCETARDLMLRKLFRPTKEGTESYVMKSSVFCIAHQYY
jgi:hypothetical protein